MYAIGAASPTRILVRNILVYPPALSLLHLHHDFYISGNNVIRYVIHMQQKNNTTRKLLFTCIGKQVQ